MRTFEEALSLLRAKKIFLHDDPNASWEMSKRGSDFWVIIAINKLDPDKIIWGGYVVYDDKVEVVGMNGPSLIDFMADHNL